MFYVGKGKRGEVRLSSESHLLVLGPPRCGKTRNIVMPNLNELDCAVVVTSTKEDIFNETFRIRQKLGRIWIFDPLESVPLDDSQTIRLNFSPVTSTCDFERAVLMARAMLGASVTGARGGSLSFWEERAEAVIAPLLLAANVAGWSMVEVMDSIENKELESAISILEANSHPEAARTLASISLSAPKELSGITSTAAGILSGYRTPKVLRSAKMANFSPSDFVSSKDTVYIVAPSTHQAILAPIVLGLLQSIREAAYSQAALDQRMAKSSRPRPSVALLLDEMANIAPIRDLSSILSEGASQGILVMGILQDLSQARSRWPGLSDGFLTLFGNTAIFPGIADVRTLSDLSILSGERIVELPTKSKSTRGYRQESLTSSFKPLLAPHEISTGIKGELLLYVTRSGFSRVLVDNRDSPSFSFRKRGFGDTTRKREIRASFSRRLSQGNYKDKKRDDGLSI
ncbi:MULTISPECIES: type IV secretory system conjugative DNA transfer family protein [Acidithrix]|uniref:type IV secretory system conjugative DNA transfer family protein n=1 Tax=Acidithrix TaxID=1609233 RepID=UPI0006991627|nr:MULTISPECIES: type IV secretory system conjugative DNA transfer family protein [Acidithrix]CAG4904077.1 unnamed protein product [Acidithrix sp. C25]